MEVVMKAFDVIVVGAGSAGCVVASRLSQESQSGGAVLLLEVGQRDNDPLIHIPAGYAKILEHALHLWPYTTTPQTQLDGRARRLEQGKVLGGGSSINAMVYARGQVRDYASWQNAVGETGRWSFDDMLPHFLRQENNDTFHNGRHNVGGPLSVTLPHGINELNLACIRAFQEAGLPYNPDYNGLTQRGVSPVQTTIGGQKRCSSAVAFLHPAEENENLDVRTGCLVHRILIENGRAIGVEYSHNNQVRQVYANEVILCAGAIQSPKILMLSGIGPADALHSSGIKVVHDAPDVGANLHDHPLVPVSAHCTVNVGYQRDSKGLHAVANGIRYLLTHDGPASTNGIESNCYFDPDDLEAEPTIQCFHLPIISENGLSPTGKQAGLTFEVVVLQPASRGSLKLKDANPESFPLIDPGWFNDAEDLRRAIGAVRFIRKAMRSPSLSAILEPNIAGENQLETDEDIVRHIKEKTTTMRHPVGSCRMGADDQAVVDAHLRVKGIEGLRIIDASIMPNIVSGNTNAPTIALADRGVDLFLADRRA
jgi:choline dehydrogenase-like flavoprotein